MSFTKPLIVPVFFFLGVLLLGSCDGQTPQQPASVTIKPDTVKRLFRDSMPQPVAYVNDYEDIFSSKDESVLDSMLADLEKRTTIQIAVVTFDTSMVTADSVDALTLRVFNAWGVGQKDKNNGVTVGISKGNRTMSIKNGFGIEKMLSNAETKTIIDTAFIPAFKEGDYFKGTYNGLQALIKTLAERAK